MNKYLWLAVTPDKYELPIYVADTARELGEKLGMKTDLVISYEHKKQSGKKLGRKIVKVRI